MDLWAALCGHQGRQEEQIVRFVLGASPRIRIALGLGIVALFLLFAGLAVRSLVDPIKRLYSEPMVLRRVLEAGANGYVLKSARGEDLLSAVRAVAAGGTYIDPAMAGALVSRALGRPEFSSGEEAFEHLTPRERQILQMVAQGLSNKEIASALDVAVKTVMAHRANLMDKLGIHNHSKLVQLAIKMGLVWVE